MLRNSNGFICLFLFVGGGSGSSSTNRGEMSLTEVQCHLDKEGASNLVIDLIMNATSDRVFHESILLAIALLEGGNTIIQVGKVLPCFCFESLQKKTPKKQGSAS